MNRRRQQANAPYQRGVTLLEVLVSIVVLALGLLGIIGMQLRTMADTQTAVRRAQAIRLIEDFSERIYANPSSLDPLVLANYVSSWTAVGATVPVPPCGAGCNSQAFALNQRSTWQNSVSQNLPSGAVMTFLPGVEVAGNRRQLGVLTSWRQSEHFLNAANADYMNPFTTSTTAVGGGSCPAGRTCHLQFVSLSSRCVPDPLSSTATVSMSYCATGVAP